MTAPTDRHMVFAVYDGHVKFEANYGQQLSNVHKRRYKGVTTISGSEPLAWYGRHTGELISEISANDMIDHLLSVFEPTTSEVIYADEEHHAEVDVPAWNPVTAMTAELEKGND